MVKSPRLPVQLSLATGARSVTNKDQKRGYDMTIKACVFDAYGTLFDVAAAARHVAADPARADFAAQWPKIAADWRDRQLQYSWLRAITGHHCDFWQVTQDGLDWALEAAGFADDADLRAALLGLYWQLEAFAEVPAVLDRLTKAGLRCAILSNGSADMLNGAVSSVGIGGYLDAVLSVDEVGVFKPADAVYALVPQHLSCTAGEVLFVSSNGWDAAGAAAFGFQTAWVNRAGAPTDRLFAQPQHICRDLTDIPKLAGV